MAGVKGRSGGSNRKSVDELKLLGTYRSDRHSNVMAKVENRQLVLPQNHIKEDYPEIDREELFRYFARNLYEQGMTTEVDSILLSQLVEAQALYLTALQFYKRDPESMIGRKLAISVALEAAKLVRSLMSEFRLTPTSRAAYAPASETEEYDEVDAFIKAKVINP